MTEFRIVVIGTYSGPALETKLNELGAEGWEYKDQIEFPHDVGLLFERWIEIAEPELTPPRTFQEAIVRLSEKS